MEKNRPFRQKNKSIIKNHPIIRIMFRLLLLMP